jgi:hypothetical protein
MDNKKEIKRIFLKQDDFCETTLNLKINTGDLLSKIRIGLYFKKDSANQFLDKILVDDIKFDILTHIERNNSK